MKKNETRKDVDDLAKQLKDELTAEQQAELGGSASPSGSAEFVDWREKIDNLNLNDGRNPHFTGEMASQLRAFLLRILEVTRDVGGRVVPIGKRIIKWIFSMIERYPNTCVTALVMAALCALVSTIPWLHFILLPIAQVVAIGLVGLVFLREVRAGAVTNNKENR